MTTSDSTNIKLTLMYLIEIICEFAFNDDAMLLENSTVLEQIFQRGLEDEDNEVRVASFKTLTIFLSSINDESLVKKFESVLAILLTKCIEAIKYDQESGKVALESLNDLIEIHPKFIKPIMPDLLRIFGEIMETEQLNSKLRITAMHGVLQLCMNHEAQIRKNEFFKSRMVGVYMKMLSENEKISAEEWAIELNTEIISKDDVSMATEEHLCQILLYLGVKFMLPLFIGSITAALSSPKSNEQHAGLTAMAVLTEGCHDIFKNELPNILALITPLVETPNPRVLNDVIVVFGYLCDEFCPDIQTTYSTLVLNLIVKCLRHPMPKLQMNGVKCIQNYCSRLDEHKEQAATITPFMEQILFEISKIFEWGITSNNFDMMCAVLNTLSTLASISSFEKYYGSFMPGLKKLTSMVGGDSQQQSIVRNLTVECIGYLLTSIKDNQVMFASECQAIMESLLAMEDTLDVDDSLHSAMFKVYAQVAGCLKQNFVYASRIIDRVIHGITAKVDYKMVDETETIPEGRQQSKFIKLKVDLKLNGGVKNLILNTDTLERKIEGTNLLVALAENMGPSFGPFVEKSMDAVVNHLSFKHSKHIRHNMQVMVKLMASCCQTTEQKLFVLGRTMPGLLSELVAVLKLQQDEDIGLILEIVASVMPFCTEQMLTNLPQLLNSALAVTKQMVKEIESEYASKEMDEELQNEMDEETESVEEVEYVSNLDLRACGRNNKGGRRSPRIHAAQEGLPLRLRVHDDMIVCSGCAYQLRIPCTIRNKVNHTLGALRCSRIRCRKSLRAAFLQNAISF